MTEQRLTVGEERLRQLFAELKLELLEAMQKKADATEVDLLATRVTHLELWQAGMVATERTARDFTGRQLVVAGIAASLVVGLLEAGAALLAHVL